MQAAILDGRLRPGRRLPPTRDLADTYRLSRATIVTAFEQLKAEGAEAIDAARQQWWIGLRSAEQEHYSASGKDFGNVEQFYRLGFEDALHARNRCREFDQVSAEMEANLEELQRQYPGVDLGDAYTEGYQRGREYYQKLCDQAKAA